MVPEETVTRYFQGEEINLDDYKLDFGSNVGFDKHADTFKSFEKVIRDCQNLLDCLDDVLSSQTLICIS